MTQCSQAASRTRGEVKTEAELAPLKAALAFIERTFRTNPTLDAIANSAGYSPFYFHRIFREHFKKTPKQIVAEFQIAEVKRLALSGITLTRAAAMTGFCHPSHMATRFKQQTGETPRQWLRKAAPIEQHS